MNESVGALASGLSADVARLVFGDCANSAIEDELPYMIQVDRAHLVMLEEAGIIPASAAAALLEEIDELVRKQFAPLRGQMAPRGLYLLYESYLIEKLGENVGGLLQVARSRNDLSATCLKLRFRPILAELILEILKLQAALLGNASRYQGVVMPVYTHGQVAQPGTYGHYLAGIARCLERDLQALTDCLGADLGECPLGAGAATGTSFPIRAERTAQLLGFRQPARHSLDAVASRDFVLRALAGATVLGVTLSRLSADLRTWLTAEFGFLWLPDCLLGSSSMMPQKRNPFLLEHIEGMSTSPLGAFVAATTSCHAKPFTNCISVGTEAISGLWEALRRITTATVLARKLAAAARPNNQRMLLRTQEGVASATEAANVLVRIGAASFRSAHRTVGRAVLRALGSGSEQLQERVLAELFPGQSQVLASLEPAAVVRNAEYGGGPGPRVTSAGLAKTWQERKATRQRLCADVRRWREGERMLERASQALRIRARGNSIRNTEQV